MKQNLSKWLILVLVLVHTCGCARLAIRAASPIIPGFTDVFFEECDLELAEKAIPSQLKLLEGLLQTDPNNRKLLTALCMGFTGYAMVFVEEENPERASNLYIRARNYGLKALGLEMTDPKALPQQLKKFGQKDMAPLFWTTLSWNAWIQLNLDKPAALGQSVMAQACLNRLLALQPDYYYGTPYILEGTILAVKPEMLGGDVHKARRCFEKALRANQGKFLLTQYYYARYYAVRVQDRDLFEKLVQEVEKTPTDTLKKACLINQAIKQKMRRLSERTDEFFF